MPKKTTDVAPKALNPELVSIKSKATSMLKKWSAPVVKTAEQFESAALAARDFIALRKSLKAILDPIIKQAKADYDEKRNAFKEVDAIIARGEDAIRDAIEAYQEAHRKAQEVRVERALDAGKDERAAAIAAKPYTPTVEGVSFVERWHGEVTDFKVFLSAIIDGRIPQEAAEPNLVWLNAQARAAKSEDIGVPGAKGVKESSSSIRA
jgi:hypothetical protein